MGRLNAFIDNAGCIGRNFTAWLEDPESHEEYDRGHWDARNIIYVDGERAVGGDAGQILYMHGESVLVTGIDKQQELVSMFNWQNTDGYECFTIPFSQFTRDFDMWPPAEI